MIRKRLVRFETKRKISFPLPFVILLLCITVHIRHVTLSSWRVFHHSSRGLEILWTQDLSSCRDYPQGAAPVEALSKQSDPCKSSSDLVPCSSTNLSSYVMLTIWKRALWLLQYLLLLPGVKLLILSWAALKVDSRGCRGRASLCLNSLCVTAEGLGTILPLCNQLLASPVPL